MPQAETHRALPDLLRLLARAQQSDGEFTMFIGRDPDLAGPLAHDSTPFVTALAADCLRHCPLPEAQDLATAARRFLARQELPRAVWRYWTPKSGKTIEPDLDDTACASFVLHAAGDTRFPDANRALLLQHRDDAGRFLTWFDRPRERNDHDSVVNANVVWYLGEFPETAPAIEFVSGVIRDGTETASFWYYLHPFALYHAVTRAARDTAPSLRPLAPTIIERIRRLLREDPRAGTSLHTALAAVSLLNIDPRHPDVPPLIERLLASRKPEGWPREAFYAGPEPPGPLRVWFGSETVTTALAVEALSRMQPHVTPETRRAGDREHALDRPDSLPE